MVITDVAEAGGALPGLIERALHGEQVMIGQAGRAVVQLVPVPQAEQLPRKPGGWEGRVRMADDFDELPADFLAYFNGEKP